MDQDCCNWDGPTTRLFLDLCIAEKEKFNFTSQGLTKDRWRNVQCSFKQVVGARFSNKQMSNKLQSLKKRYQAWNDLQNSSGLGRNKATGGAEADARWWDEQQTRQDAREVEDTAEAAEPRGAPPPYADQLYILFGSHQDRGSFMFAGGISESTTPARHDSAGPSSKRAAEDNEVNSLPKKKSFSAEDFMRQISESIVHTREQAEVFEVMEMLRQDGVPEGSELYFKALDLFKNSVCRAQYKNMHDPANRIAWIEWTWTYGKQK